MSWEKKKLSECCESISDGDHQAPPKAECGIPFVTIANINKYNQIDFQNIMFVPREYYDCLDDKRKPRPNDILYSVVGSFGIPVFMKREAEFVFQRHIAILRPNRGIFPKFLYYVMLSREFYMQADSVAIGAAQRTISLTALRNMEVQIPPIEIQHRIADILSSYDDLIENNQKQIKLLEEAAQRLYKEWFVDLHFPGWENATIVDGIPDGWKKESLIDIVDVQYGFAFNGALFNSEKKGTPIIRIRNIPSAQTDDYTTESAEERYMVHNGDILIGMDGEFHINTWGGSDGYLVQRVCSFRPHDESIKGYLLQAIVAPIKFFEKTVVGATVAHLGKKHIDSIEILTAPAEYYAPFQTWYKKRQLLMNQNVFLKEARDRLLPKLMSDELEV